MTSYFIYILYTAGVTCWELDIRRAAVSLVIFRYYRNMASL